MPLIREIVTETVEEIDEDDLDEMIDDENQLDEADDDVDAE